MTFNEKLEYFLTFKTSWPDSHSDNTKGDGNFSLEIGYILYFMLGLPVIIFLLGACIQNIPDSVEK